MNRAKRGFGSLRFVLLGLMAIGGAGLSGCNGDGSSTAPAASASSPAGSAAGAGTPANSAPTIQGTAITTATVGKAYSFQPKAADANSDAITFGIMNKPAWATFNAATGQLSGTPTPTDVGKYAGVQITASDGKAVVSLPSFAISVTAASAGASSVSLNWVAPTENSDGTPLQDLKGFKIHYGAQSQSYTGAISVNNPTLTTFLVDSLPSGKYFFAITAFNSQGIESSLSDEIAATFN